MQLCKGFCQHKYVTKISNYHAPNALDFQCRHALFFTQVTEQLLLFLVGAQLGFQCGTSEMKWDKQSVSCPAPMPAMRLNLF